MSLRKNVVANFVGQGWRAIMSLVFLPLYIDYLGMEAFGLIGIFVMLQAWLRLVDLGMRPAVLREMARFTGGEHDAESIRDLLRSIEIVAAGAAVAAGRTRRPAHSRRYLYEQHGWIAGAGPAEHRDQHYGDLSRPRGSGGAHLDCPDDPGLFRLANSCISGDSRRNRVRRLLQAAAGGPSGPFFG